MHLNKELPAIVVTGASGQVGRALQRSANSLENRYQFRFYDRAGLNIADAGQLRSSLDLPFDYLVNAAAYTAVDKAESEESLAFEINAQGPGLLSSLCEARSAGMLHLSSDYVYHNALRRPLLETDPTEPQGAYARSKLAGDLLVLKHHPQAVILRTSWVYAADGHNFVRTMLRLGAERTHLRVVADQIGAPTWADSIAAAIVQVLDLHFEGRPMPGGVYNYADAGSCTWCDFARKIFELCQMPVQVEAIASADYPTPASRPPYSVLDCSKFIGSSGFKPASWQENLARCLEKM